MVLLYKDPDGVDVFPTQTGPQFTVDITQCGPSDFVDIDAFKHKIKQLENELMKYNKVFYNILYCDDAFDHILIYFTQKKNQQ